jgi:Cell wall-associated hydrolases (invasion-associated proteins)
MAQNRDMKHIIQEVQEKYAPDKRVEVFHVEAILQADTLVLKGETTSGAAYEELLSRVKKNFVQVKDSIRILPDKKLGEEIWGIVNNSVGTLRSAPRYSAELVTQALLGMPVKILEARGGWRRIQTPDNYIGWMNGSLASVTEPELQEYLQKPKVIVTSMYAHSLEKPALPSQPVSDLVAGDMLAVKAEKRKFYHVSYPDGREAYVKKSDAGKVPDWLRNNELTGENIVKTALQFTGVPYLWGGTSPKGLDCSGFTKSVYFMHGIILARDASQQVLSGKLIDSSGDFSDAQPGDLVFFGSKATGDNPKERVVHVGIYIGNKRFIHASDYIHISSFDSADPLYDAYNANRYLRTKRIIGEGQAAEVDEINRNAFYNP